MQKYYRLSWKKLTKNRRKWAFNYIWILYFKLRQHKRNNSLSKQILLILADRERSHQMNLHDLSTRYNNTKPEWGVNPLFKFLNPS